MDNGYALMRLKGFYRTRLSGFNNGTQPNGSVRSTNACEQRDEHDHWHSNRDNNLSVTSNWKQYLSEKTSTLTSPLDAAHIATSVSRGGLRKSLGDCTRREGNDEPTTHGESFARVRLLLSPLQLFDRLDARLPPPRVHRHPYFGVLARMPALRNVAR